MVVDEVRVVDQHHELPPPEKRGGVELVRHAGPGSFRDGHPKRVLRERGLRLLEEREAAIAEERLGTGENVDGRKRLLRAELGSERDEIQGGPVYPPRSGLQRMDRVTIIRQKEFRNLALKSAEKTVYRERALLVGTVDPGTDLHA